MALAFPRDHRFATLFASAALSVLSSELAKADCARSETDLVVSISITECSESGQYPGALRVRGDIRERIVFRYDRESKKWTAEAPSNHIISDAAAVLHEPPYSWFRALIKITCADVSGDTDKLWYFIRPCYDTVPRPEGKPVFDLRAHHPYREKQLLAEIAEIVE